MTAILGISAYYHNSAAAPVVDGEIIAAQEDRSTRRKHGHECPIHAIKYCLREGNLDPGQLDYVGFNDRPLLKFDRLLETYLAYASRGLQSFVMAMQLRCNEKLHLPP